VNPRTFALAVAMLLAAIPARAQGAAGGDESAPPPSARSLTELWVAVRADLTNLSFLATHPPSSRGLLALPRLELGTGGRIKRLLLAGAVNGGPVLGAGLGRTPVAIDAALLVAYLVPLPGAPLEVFVGPRAALVLLLDPDPSSGTDLSLRAGLNAVLGLHHRPKGGRASLRVTLEPGAYLPVQTANLALTVGVDFL
jgi:hypothetical protein